MYVSRGEDRPPAHNTSSIDEQRSFTVVSSQSDNPTRRYSARAGEAVEPKPFNFKPEVLISRLLGYNIGVHSSGRIMLFLSTYSSRGKRRDWSECFAMSWYVHTKLIYILNHLGIKWTGSNSLINYVVHVLFIFQNANENSWECVVTKFKRWS